MNATRQTYPIPEGYLMLSPGAKIKVGDKIWMKELGFRELTPGSLLIGAATDPQRHPCLIRRQFSTIVGAEDDDGLTFQHFDEMNQRRHEDWPRKNNNAPEWTLSDWGIAVAEEAGEVCGAIKRFNRIAGGQIMNGGTQRVHTEKEAMLLLQKEIGDTVTYLSLLAQRAGSSLEECCRLAYNGVSERENLPHRI